VKHGSSITTELKSKYRKALRAGVLRRAVSLGRPLVGYSAAAPSISAMRLRGMAFRAAHAKTGPNALAASRDGAKASGRSPLEFQHPPPNPTLNRRPNGRSPWPRGSCGSSSASRPRRPAVGPRLAPRSASQSPLLTIVRPGRTVRYAHRH
jgi:hypothetical protein